MILKKYYFIVILFLISIFTHFYWFTGWILQYGDYIHYSNSFWLSKVATGMWSSFGGLGTVNVLGWGFPHFFLYGLLSHLQIPQNISEKIITLLPSLLGGVFGVYYLGISIGLGGLGSLVASLLFNFNTYYLVARDHIYIYSAEVASLWAILSYAKYYKTSKFRYFILTFIALFYSLALDPRGSVLGYVVFVLYVFTLVINGNRKRIRFIADPVLLGITLALSNMYWILPQYTAKSLTHNQILNRELFGNQYWTITHALTLYHPFWTGGKPTWFTVQQPPLIYWTVPLLFFITFFLLRKLRKPMTLLFAGIAIVGIIFAKQIDIPFGGVYIWLFDTIPGFSAFRDASKFYYFIALGYAITIGYGLTLVGKISEKIQRIGYYLLVAIVVTISAVIPAAAHGLGKIGKLDVPADIPQEYRVAVNYLNAVPKQETRTLLIPDYQGFVDVTMHSPVVGLNALKDTYWFLSLENGQHQKDYGDKPLMNALASEKLEQALQNAAIEYIFIGSSKRNISEIEATYSIDMAEIKKILDTKSFLKKEYENPYGTIYKVIPEPYRLKTCGMKPDSEGDFCVPVIFTRNSESNIRFRGDSLLGSFLVYADTWNPNWKLVSHELSVTERLFPWTIQGITPEKDTYGFQKYQLGINIHNQIRKSPVMNLYFIPDLYRIHGTILSIIGTAGIILVTYLSRKR